LHRKENYFFGLLIIIDNIINPLPQSGEGDYRNALCPSVSL